MGDVNADTENLSKLIISAAKEAIPLSSPFVFKKRVPWWSDKIKDATQFLGEFDDIFWKILRNC